MDKWDLDHFCNQVSKKYPQLETDSLSGGDHFGRHLGNIQTWARD